jgi:hypothetical protein
MSSDMKMTGNEETPAALISLRKLKVEASPFLTQRVLNNFEAAKKQSNKPWFYQWFWKVSTALSCAALVGLAVKFSILQTELQSKTQAHFSLNRPYLIRVDIRDLSSSEVAYAEVVLAKEGMQFASQDYVDLKDQHKLTVVWEHMLEKQYLPIVVSGTKSGAGQVKVYFYDQENKLVDSKEINLSFDGV